MKNVLKYTLFLIILAFTQSFAQANGKIKGVVVDANNNEELIGANVMIMGTSIGAATNFEGEFILSSVKPGSYTLKISYIGYKERTIEIDVLSNRTVEIKAKLDWIAVVGDEVIVSAQAKGQLSAINEQLSSDEIKNVVSKERIRELPDRNAAESVGRLPGVSLSRSNGEGSKVVIRGLQPKYSKILVDGVSLAATGSNDRSVSMSSISSYSLDGIEVIKSPTANMDGDQVGGSVNLRMRTAPEGLNYEFIAEGGYNSLRKYLSDYSLVGSFSTRFLDNKLGLFSQVIADNKNMGSNRMNAKYEMLSEGKEFNPLGITDVNLIDSYRTRKRYGGTLTLDYLLPDGKIYFKNYINTSESENQIYSENYNDGPRTNSTQDISSNSIIFTNIIGYDQYLSIFKVNAKLAHTFTSGETPNDIKFEFYNDNDMSSVPSNAIPKDVPSYANNNYDNFFWIRARDNAYENQARQIMTKVDFETDFSITNQITGKLSFGGKFRYDERSYDKEQYLSNPQAAPDNFLTALSNGVPQFNGSTSFNYPLFYDRDFTHDEFLKGDYHLGSVADINMMHNILSVLREERNKSYSGIEMDGYRYLHYSSLRYDYTGTERLYAGYMMMNLKLSREITFIPGVRYEKKNTVYSGVYGSSSGRAEDVFHYNDTTSVRNNDFWLPMVHLRYVPTDWLQIRLAYTHTLARPNFTAILPNMDINDTRVNMNNPHLTPELAQSYDIYFAFSENHLGLLTLGGFWKNIKDKIFSRGNRPLLNPEEFNIDPKHKGKIYSTYENNKEVSISKGIEIDWQTNFWYLPSFFKGIVLNVNYTKIFSTTKYPLSVVYQTGTPWAPKDSVVDESYWDRLENQPSDIINVALGYDYKDFSGRISLQYTSDVFIGTNFFQERRSSSDDLTVVDIRLNQKLPWYGIEVYCNFVNVGGSIETVRFAGENKLRSQSHYGSAILAGLKWRLESK